jgi:hypothetical protein
VRSTLFGLIANRGEKHRARCLDEVRKLGAHAK